MSFVLSGVDECQQWKSDLPANVLTESALRSMPTSNDETGNSSLLNSKPADIPDGNVINDPSIKSIGSLQAPGSAVVIPIRPTLVELGGRSRPVDNLNDSFEANQQPKPKQNKEKQQLDQKQQRPQQQQQQQSDQQQLKSKSKEQHKQKQQQMLPVQQQMFSNAASAGGGLMHRMAGPGPVLANKHRR